VPVLLVAMVLTLAGCNSLTAAVSSEKSRSDPNYIYGIPMDDRAGIIAEGVADIYSAPDIQSERVTQVLYNQPVSILQEKEGWAKVTVVDGSTGWMKKKYIDKDLSSVDGRGFTHRIIVTGREKSITSSRTGGITLMSAPMGTELYAFNSSGDSYEVTLPGKKTGWLKGSGMIHIKLDQKIPVTNADDFAATAMRLKGASYLSHGMSVIGIDAPGLVYICARINGIDLPRSIKGQLASGTEVKPEDAKAGDLVFLAGTGEGEANAVTSVGICIGGGKFLCAGRSSGYAAVCELDKDGTEGTVAAVRRIFN
jgi:hypothetical protein